MFTAARGETLFMRRKRQPDAELRAARAAAGRHVTPQGAPQQGCRQQHVDFLKTRSRLRISQLYDAALRLWSPEDENDGRRGSKTNYDQHKTPERTRKSSRLLRFNAPAGMFVLDETLSCYKCFFVMNNYFNHE